MGIIVHPMKLPNPQVDSFQKFWTSEPENTGTVSFPDHFSPHGKNRSGERPIP